MLDYNNGKGVSHVAQSAVAEATVITFEDGTNVEVAESISYAGNVIDSKQLAVEETDGRLILVFGHPRIDPVTGKAVEPLITARLEAVGVDLRPEDA